jgi:ABC-2 type transport system permease protein
MRLLYAEALKVRTAPRTLIGLALGLVALAVLGAGSTASSGPTDRPQGDAIVTWDVLSVATTGVIFALILGILVVTWEYRHGTITQTFLATPRRERVLGAKFVVALVLGFVLAVLCVVVVLVTATFWISLDLRQKHWELIGRIVLASALWGLLGAGLGALLQSQVGAIVVAFVWFLVAEPLIAAQFDHFADYLPGNALNRLTQHGTVGGIEHDGQNYSFGLWAAAFIAGAYALGVAALGTASALKRDVN